MNKEREALAQLFDHANQHVIELYQCHQENMELELSCNKQAHETITQALTELEVLKERVARYESIIKVHRQNLEPHRHVSVCAPFAINELDEIIEEMFGASKC